MDSVLDQVRSNYYSGNFQSCIRLVDDSDSISKKGSAVSEQLKFYGYRSMIEMKRYKTILDELDIEKCSDVMKVIRYYVEYLENDQKEIKSEGVVDYQAQLDKIKTLYNFYKNAVDKNIFEMISLVLSQFYLQIGHLEDSYSVLSMIPFSLESFYMRILLLLNIGQYTQAEDLHLQMKKNDNFDILTQISGCMINLKLKKNCQEVLQVCSTLLQSVKPSSMLINMQATAQIIQSNYEEAATLTSSVLEMNSSDSEAVVNWYIICTKLDKSKEVVDRARRAAIQFNQNFSNYAAECDAFFES